MDILKTMQATLWPSYCSYYQAHVERESCWFVVAILKSYEHLAFDRTIDTESSLFEFFVPFSTESYFLELIAHLESKGLVRDLKKLPNRLFDGSQKV